MDSVNKKMEFKFDYFSVTFPLECHKDNVEDMIIDETVEMVGKFFNVEKKLCKREPKATNRYRVQYTIGESIILRLAGPEDASGFKTCHLELKGEGCREFERRCPEKNWISLFIFLNILNAKATRIDIAIDDFSNQLDLEWLDKKFRNRFYTSSILTKPKPIGTIDSGMSITLGTNISPIQVVIYDKKYEREDSGITVEEENWTRYEMRFRTDRAKTLYRELYKTLKVSKDEYADTFKKTAFGLLYKIIDIKKDNHYSAADQKKVATDEKWLEFLENAKKITMPPSTKKELSYESFMKRHEKSTADYLLFHYLLVNRDIETFEIEMYKLLYRNTIHDKGRFHRLNLYLDQVNLPALTDVEVDELRTEFFEIISDRELPF